MKNISLIILILSLTAVAVVKGQNLVPNGDFESYNQCPTDISQLTNTSNWVSPTGNTPDYFNSCATSTSGVSVPVNGFGNENAHSGEGYAGFYATSSSDYADKEFIQDTLLAYLVAGQIYYFEMYLSLSDNSCLATKIGVYFSDSAIGQTSNGSMNYNPQIVTSNIVTGKLGWTKISGCFIALGGEHFITIGNFQSPINTSVTTVGSCLSSWTNNCYYYIDDVILTNRSHSMRNDTNFCGTTVSMDLSTPFPNAQNYFWSTSENTSTIHINSPNYYWVKIVDSVGCFYFTDSFNIQNTIKPSINLGPDTTLCPNSSFLITPTYSSGVSFVWQNNSTDSFININHTGLYWAKVTTPFGCKNTDTINITATLPKNFLANTIHYCDSTAFPILLSASATNANSYLWNNNATDSFINVNSAGNYWLQVTKGACTIRDTINVLKDTLPVLDLGNDSVACYGTYFNITSPPADFYKWYRTTDINPKVYFLYSTSQSVPIYTSGSFALTLRKGNCFLHDTVKYDFEVKPAVNLGSDTIMCKNSPITYKITYPLATYLWSTGSTDSTNIINSAGTYWAEVNNLGCKNRDTVKITESTLEPFTLGPDTALCQGQTLLLDATTTGATSYKWSTNTLTHTINVNISGRYWAEAKELKCVVRDTINVMFNAYPIVNLGHDTTVCKNVFLTLNAQNTGATYLWGNGSTNQTIIVNQTSSYFVKVTKNNCSSSDTIDLSFQAPPSINIGNDTIVCEGTQLLLNATYPASTYKWQDGSTSSKITVSNSGKYLVTVTHGVCKVRDSIMIYHELKPSLNLGHDTSYCFNQPVLLDVSNTAADTYLWSNGSTSNKFMVNSPGLYWVKINRGVCYLSDSIIITQKPLPIDNLGNDIKACKETILTLDAGNSGSTYLWNDQSTTQTINVKAPGLFFVEVKNSEGCFAFDSITLDTFTSPIVLLGKDTFVCEGSGFEIDAGTQFKSYLWQDSSTSNFVIAKSAGNYFVLVKDMNNCSASDTIQISVKQKPVINLAKQIKVCEPDFLIKPSGKFISYLWQDGTTSSSYHVTDYGIYTLNVTDANYCSNEDTIDVLSNCPGTVYVPNAFTPNDDGNNEMFYPVLRNVKSLYMKIYNRWGMLVFETNEVTKGWDGKYKGNFAEQDVYIYTIDYVGLDNNNYTKMGNVTLLR